ncbi:MAG: hypothetical protein QM726_04830 [Chitinophagaceae bacterium]
MCTDNIQAIENFVKDIDSITESEVESLYNDFCHERDYKSRLAFFDIHFGLLPYPFPSFDIGLQFLYVQDKASQLMDIYKKESAKSVCLKKHFSFNKKNYDFDVTPFNSCPPVFNNYVLNKFISQDDRFDAIVNCIEVNGHYEEVPVTLLLQQSDNLLEFISHTLVAKRKKDVKTRMANVFLSGYNDYLSGVPRIFRYRKKLIELYLYSQGILYCKYRQCLKLRNIQHEALNDFSINGGPVLNWTEQILLLKKMGVLDLLKNKTNKSFEVIEGNSYQHIICQIIGQEPHMADSIGHYLQTIDQA